LPRHRANGATVDDLVDSGGAVEIELHAVLRDGVAAGDFDLRRTGDRGISRAGIAARHVIIATAPSYDRKVSNEKT
jgi:hypothetical protein